MLRNLLAYLVNRPSRPDGVVRDTAPDAMRNSTERAVRSEAFQPIRSQEEILQEEVIERASSKRTGVISRFLDENPARRVRSRPSHRANEAP